MRTTVSATIAPQVRLRAAHTTYKIAHPEYIKSNYDLYYNYVITPDSSKATRVLDATCAKKNEIEDHIDVGKIW